MSTTGALVGARLLRERTKRGWSLRAAAEKSGVSFNTITRIEHGNEAVFSAVAALADTLGMSLDALIAPSPCVACDGFPPAGYTCNDCGRAGAS